jgi:hypothetical protein
MSKKSLCIEFVELHCSIDFGTVTVGVVLAALVSNFGRNSAEFWLLSEITPVIFNFY